jgi:ABC-type Fe3+/spermidine/putrescine transport system ATPase subunit
MHKAKAQLKLQNLTKVFAGRVVAVNDVSLEVEEGTFTTLLGPSGCGKTTTLRLIAGFYDPDRGEIWLRDRKLNGVPPFRRPMAIVFQDYALFPHMTVFENVAFGLRMRRLPRREVAQRVQQTLEFLGLQGLDNRRPDQLSGGQQQRVALARSLVVEPEVLLLDEPLSNLDAKLREQVRTEIRLLQRQMGITTVYVTHDQEEALALSDWVAVMNEGRVVQVGRPQDIYYFPQSRFVADFVGISTFFPARVISVNESECLVMTAIGSLVVRPGRRDVTEGDEVLVLVRPETVRMSVTPFPERDAFPNRAEGRVTNAIFLGAITRYWIEVGGMEVIVDHYNPGPVATFTFTGTVYLSFDPERLWLLPAREV